MSACVFWNSPDSRSSSGQTRSTKIALRSLGTYVPCGPFVQQATLHKRCKAGRPPKQWPPAHAVH